MLILKKTIKKLIIIISFALLLPFIQKQWLNLSLLSQNKYSFYSVIYYLSAILFPLLISFLSLTEFTEYKFFESKENVRKFIKGKSLLALVVCSLIPLSLISIYYLNINIEFIVNNFFRENLIYQISNLQNLFIILIISILFVFKNIRILLKKIILTNFILFSLLVWHGNINSQIINDTFLNKGYLNLENNNVTNIFFLFSFELFFYIWSYVAYKNNLSNWEVPMPSIREVKYLYKFIIFLIISLVYYSLVEK